MKAAPRRTSSSWSRRRCRRRSSWVQIVLARQYQLGVDLRVAAADPDTVYDWQDEFYLPLTGFKAIQRPGPNLRIFVRTGTGYLKHN